MSRTKGKFTPQQILLKFCFPQESNSDNAYHAVAGPAAAILMAAIGPANPRQPVFYAKYRKSLLSFGNYCDKLLP